MRFAGKRCVVADRGAVAEAVAARLSAEGAGVATSIDELVGIDVLVTAFVTRADRPFLELEDEVWTRTLDENLKAAFLVAREAARRMGPAA